MLERMRAAVDVARRKRPGVLEVAASMRAQRRADALQRACAE